MVFGWRSRTHVLAALAWFWLPAVAQAAETPCANLKSISIPAAGIGLPTRGATTQSAEVIAASPDTVGTNGTFVAGSPAFCKVLGVISPVDPDAPVINFQLNLPATWNGKAVQYGGGGFNGTLVTGLGPGADAPPGMPTPLGQGYATLGTDSGHQSSSLPEIQAFALNDEALVNFAYASYKKVRDVAVELMRQRYGRPPVRMYYMGTSEGGREGLTMAQRFPTDYDGVISRVPVINWTALQHAGHRTGVAQQNGGWMNAAKVALVAQAILRACDSLDGLADGIVSDYQGCGPRFGAEALRCPSGEDTGDTCLSERQVAALNSLHSSFQFPFAVANGVRAYPAYGYGGEAQAGGFSTWLAGTRAAAFPPPAGGGQGQLWSFGNGAIRYFIMRDGNADPFTYSPDAYADRVRQISALMDSTNPDLSKFAAHGGKLILKEHMADYAQSPFAGIGYYETVVTGMGQRAVDQFVRLYVTPGVGHGGSGVTGTTGERIPQYVDLLGVLDNWVDRKNPPANNLVQTSVTAAPPFTVTASRPMCRYPTYPRYRGSGDPKLASSFTCAKR
jgi:hypothetical protein